MVIARLGARGQVPASYAVEGAIVVHAPQPDHHWHASGYAVEAAFVLALLATIPLPVYFRAGAERLGWVVARTVQVGFAAMLVSALTVRRGGRRARRARRAGRAVARRRDTGWWNAPLALLGLVFSMALGDHGGGILFGLAWIAISIALRDRPEQHVPVSARA